MVRQKKGPLQTYSTTVSIRSFSSRELKSDIHMILRGLLVSKGRLLGATKINRRYSSISTEGKGIYLMLRRNESVSFSIDVASTSAKSKFEEANRVLNSMTALINPHLRHNTRVSILSYLESVVPSKKMNFDDFFDKTFVSRLQKSVDSRLHPIGIWLGSNEGQIRKTVSVSTRDDKCHVTLVLVDSTMKDQIPIDLFMKNYNIVKAELSHALPVLRSK